ncbi:DUF6241 domain-containing protein [Bacillus sp. 165]|uniref:DUF6241 domain-containing protein n=1 Tax=Bacillus sp. 165 TaxID=1529117 RepID=UPI001AD9A507|nr:DUF6241 domain-containing protein [Bacillus sp. 165]MBO9128950.1 hypothetical protein [Bacillus sp. 165]
MGEKKSIQISMAVVSILGITTLCFLYWAQIVQKVQNVVQLFQEEQTAAQEEKAPIETGFSQDIYKYTDKDIQVTLNKMSHQKVAAGEKWGFIAITSERVDSLIEMIETRKNELQNENFYLEILKRWKKNDFSKAVNDHNIIWEMQNGNIGKATKLLNPEEEQQYIKRTKDEG